jgi:SAM-dependent methyltransferase
MNDDFYAAFEEKFRGPRSLIKSRLRAYLPFVEPLAGFYRGQSIVDLGCGRGEWLELMEASGFKSHGVDLDAGMLKSCRELGLSVEQRDAVAFITSLKSESQVVVSAFHFVEHISFSDLRTVVAEASRVLLPGGLLIMETPNPENVMVATQNFYLDPTHERPIPPQLLSFIPEYYGFARIKILRLHEPDALHGDVDLGIHDVLGGVSPDYAVIAQKSSDEDLWSKTGRALARDIGFDLGTLAGRYDGQILAKTQQAEVKAQEAETHALQAEVKAQEAETHALQAEVKAQEAETHALQAEVKAQEAETHALQAENALSVIYSSHSWRITAPLRWFGVQLRHMRHPVRPLRTACKAQGFRLQLRLITFFNRRPTLRRRVARIARKLGIYNKMRNYYFRAQIRQSRQPQVFDYSANDAEGLTPRARKIYNDLLTAIENREAEF